MTHTARAVAGEALRSLADRFWDGYLSAYPTWATVIGDRRFDDRLENVSPAAIAARVDWLDEIAAAAKAIVPDGLSPTERVTRQMLVDEAAGQAASIRTGTHEWTVDPLSGPAVTLLDLVDYQPIRTPDEGRAMVARWRGIGDYLDERGAGLRRAAGEGRVAVRNPVERVIDVLRGLDAMPPEEWKLASPAAVEHEGWSTGDHEAFRKELRGAVREVAVPAFRRYREILEGEILPAARPQERPGIVHVPGGAEAYRTWIRVHTTLELEPEALHATGLAEIERIDAEFVELGRRVLGTKDLESTLAALRDDPRLRFDRADEVFETAKRSLVRAQAAIGGWFGRVPG
ncbi:MAG: DUF885 domain-containing protein, partial [Chloroflexi bacterium]